MLYFYTVVALFLNWLISPSKNVMSDICIFMCSQDAVRNGLVATEVLMWFYIGEIIGKGGLIGYDV